MGFAHKNTKPETKSIPAQRAIAKPEIKGGFSLEDNRSHVPLQKKANTTGLPDQLKSGIENLSGFSLDDVKVHYHSSKPAQLQAHAFAQGNQIHLASGQEKHLPHEAWHVVQQKQGRVQPTLQAKNVAINDDIGLEREADRMGKEAIQLKKANLSGPSNSPSKSSGALIQRASKNQNVFQLLSKEQFNHLEKGFSSHGNWETFYANQKDIQKDLVENDMKGEDYGFTTFGKEYEMIPYKNENPVANTAHIKLAEGEGLSFKSAVKDELVTDSDNVIEYVSPVFVLPLDYTAIEKSSIVEQSINHIKQVRSFLTKFRKELSPEKFSTLKELVDSEKMKFTTWIVKENSEEKEKKEHNWRVMDQMNLSYKNIDEKTDIDKLRKAPNNKNAIEGITLGLEVGSGTKKNAKHAELKNESVEGSAMQSTVLLPLNVVTKILGGLMQSREEKASTTGKIQNKANTTKSKEKKTSLGSGLQAELSQAIINSIKVKPDNELLDAIHLFSQRLSLVLEAPHAVTFMAHYQSLKYDDTPRIENQDLLKKYTDEEQQYQQNSKSKTLDNIPNNFHIAHSAIKDRFTVWTRIHLDDLTRYMLLLIDKQTKKEYKSKVLAEALAPILKKKQTETGKPSKKEKGAKEEKKEPPSIYSTGEEILGKIKAIAINFSSDLEKKISHPHNTVHFLEENETYLDLRQDTLRNLQIIDGTPWVLVELRI
ncbi:MAG: DUF4157 domain-containing protein [Flavobacteriaceae bacterium]